MDKRLRDLGSPNEEVDVEWNKRGNMSRDVNTVPTHPPIHPPSSTCLHDRGAGNGQHLVCVCGGGVWVVGWEEGSTLLVCRGCHDDQRLLLL